MIRGIIIILSTLALSAALSFTGAVGVSSPHRADDDLQVLWEEPYDFSYMTGGFSSWGPHYTQDDFTLETDAIISAVECWAYYGVEPDHHPQPFYVGLRYDHYGMPGGYYAASYSPHPEETYTGDVYMGIYPVYHYLMNLIDDIGVEAGTPFWLEIYSVAEDFSWGTRHPGNLYYTWQQYNCSAFFRLLGTPLDTGVDPASWGEIKAGYSD
jgi:hypothetical protein